MSEESKRKLSESLKGKNIGKTRTPEQKTRISDMLKNRERSPMSEETKIKISKALSGRKRGEFTVTHKEKISAALLGKERTKEHSLNISKKLKGRVPGKEERENYLKSMSAGITKCEHCGFTTTKGNYRRWHGDNCKLKS